MKIKYRGLNSNETYCCTQKELKKFFKNSDMSVYFGYLISSRNENLNNLLECPNKNAQERVLAKMVVCKNRIGLGELPVKPYLIFFVLNKEKYTDDLHKLFVEEAMPKMSSFYNQHKDEDDLLNYGAASLIVTLSDNSFRFYERKEKRL